METLDKLKQIKRSFRLYMNGVTANSMREKGLNYKINWGVSQMDIRRMASQYGKDKALAESLWAECNIRECQLLATLIMPADKMNPDMAMTWLSTANSVEIVEMSVFNLFQYIEKAETLACNMLCSERIEIKIGAYNLVNRLLRRNEGVQSSTYETFFKMVKVDLKKYSQMATSLDRQLLHSVVNCLNYIASSNKEQAKEADKLLIDFGFCAF